MQLDDNDFWLFWHYVELTAWHQGDLVILPKCNAFFEIPYDGDPEGHCCSLGEDGVARAYCDLPAEHEGMHETGEDGERIRWEVIKEVR